MTELTLTEHDRVGLQDLANSVIMEGLGKWNACKAQNYKVDENHWKLVQQRHNLKMYKERSSSDASGELLTGNGLPMVLATGHIEGKLEDLLYGLISTTLEEMRIKASYVDDWSGAAVLDTVVEPSLEDPFQSLVVKWMELDLPFASTNLVKNRDYVYLEGTGYVKDANGNRLGYHLIHSVGFPNTPDLPNRIRANMSAVGFWKQTAPNTFEMLKTAVMDPRGDMIKKIAVPAMVNALMSCSKFAYCGQMKKLAFILDKRYKEAKQHGAPNKKSVCVTCSAPISGRRLGDFGKSNSTCKLCFGFVCHSCKISRKLSFVDPDLLLSQRKVTFCAACMSEVTSMSATDVARAHMLANGNVNTIPSSLTSDENSTSLVSDN
ncbi:hypothetical protein BBJ29_003272 [Phytophthora kernoviae]|uniref:START domain-containing protein n=1 Tax=Phytophthora kernoviae TaxID=325452 RepID=A0A3F2RYQ0_9STRA|nr:hypothetical protein BBJ29_003272 [Phytophthora kernoviae]RLN66894.1 hypothetical protein BBP00_00001931 [Phytophthora kernoviae]